MDARAGFVRVLAGDAYGDAGDAADRMAVGSDRIAPPILVCMTLFGALYASLYALTPNLWHLYAVFLLLGLVGPGTSAVRHASLISRWFTERRGLALGLAMSGTALGGVIWPRATQGLLNQFGWRNAYAISGGAVLLIAVPLLFLLLKEPSTIARKSEQSAIGAQAEGLTRGEALRGSLLWLLLFAFFIISMSIHACMIHLVPMLKDRGMTPESAALTASLFGAAGMIRAAGNGLPARPIASRARAAIAFSVVAAGIFLLFAGATGGTAYPRHADRLRLWRGVGDGSVSGRPVFRDAVVRRNLQLPFHNRAVGGALGVSLMGAGFDRTGSYQLVLLICGVATVVAALALLRLGSYPVFSKNLSR